MEDLKGVREQYRREASRYDRKWASYLARSLGETLSVLGIRPGGRLLDLGCGTGALLERVHERFPTARLHGVDPSPEMLALARERLGGRAALFVGDAHGLPFAAASFDTVASTSNFHHFREPELALREIARVLRPGGQLVLTDWNDDYPVLRVYSRLLRLTDPSHHRSYTSAHASRLLREAGLVVDTVRAFRVNWLWGMMTLSAHRPT